MDAATFSHYSTHLQAERWSQWFSFQQDNFTPQEIPTSAGLYRVAVMENHEERLLSLTYVGQTGRSLRERIQTLWREIYHEQKPENHPHVAAPPHWHFRHRFSNEHFQCLVFPLPHMQGKDRREDREALESLAITLWRQQHGIYPLVNFGSLNGDGESIQERLAFVRTALSSMPQLHLEKVIHPRDTQWLLVPWSDWLPVITSTQMKQRGIYRVWDTSDVSEHRLEKIGFGVLAQGLSAYRPKQKDSPGRYMFSWFAPHDWHVYQYHAFCNDLASAYVIFHRGRSILNIAA